MKKSNLGCGYIFGIIFLLNINFFSDLSSSTPLIDAVKEKEYEKIEMLLKDLSVDVNEVDEAGETALHFAVYKADKKSVEKILNSEKVVDINIQDAEGYTPLMLAIENMRGKINILNMLLAKNPRMDLQNKWGYTVLHIIIKERSCNIIEEGNFNPFMTPKLIDIICEKCIELECDILDIQDNKGQTAIFMAADFEYCTELVRLLYSSADPTIPNNIGTTLFHLAVKRELSKFIIFLLYFEMNKYVESINGEFLHDDFLKVVMNRYKNKNGTTPYDLVKRIKKLRMEGEEKKIIREKFEKLFSMEFEQIRNMIKKNEYLLYHIPQEYKNQI